MRKRGGMSKPDYLRGPILRPVKKPLIWCPNCGYRHIGVWSSNPVGVLVCYICNHRFKIEDVVDPSP
jgi:transcription elongation factor Elf1